MEIDGLLHLAGALVMCIVLIIATHRRTVSAARTAYLAFTTLALGVTYNVLFTSLTVIETVTFKQVSYGSFFISLGYALIVASAYIGIRHGLLKR
jgi:hypothetical protein